MKKLTFNKDGLTPYALYSDLYPMEKNSPYKDNFVNIKDVEFFHVFLLNLQLMLLVYSDRPIQL